jgi:micrococcal nuclease
MMQLSVNEQTITHSSLKIVRVVDGDGIIVKNIFDNKEFEIRFLGIDAPELKLCKKLKQDEIETNLAAHFLMELGKKSFNYLLEIAPPNTNISICTENNNIIDVYGRTLAYVYLQDGTCLNEIMVANGFAKPYDRFYCSALPTYQSLNLIAKIERKGLYTFIDKF